MLPRIAGSGMPANRVGLLGWPRGTAQPVVRGTQINFGDWLALGGGMQSHHRTFGPNEFVTLTVDADDFAHAAMDFIGRELGIVAGTMIRPPADLSAWLASIIDAACRVARTTPEVFLAPLAGAALEQSLLHAMILCFVHGEAYQETMTRSRHVAIAQRLEAAVQQHAGRPMLMRDLCRAVGVSARALRTVCEEQLAISPQQYLTLRRLHMTREALLRTHQHAATVTQIATDHGFWELGRFAGCYKSLFGESPSATLRRSAD